MSETETNALREAESQPASMALSPQQHAAGKVESQATEALTKSENGLIAMRKAVEANGLRLDPASGKDICLMLDEQMSRVDAWLRQLGGLAGHAPLGRNPVGTAMAAKFAGLADGANGSFVEVLTRYRRILDEAREAVNDAMRRYDEIDAGIADSFRKLV